MNVQDTTLPPGWTLASAATYEYSLPAPIAANNLPTAGEAGTTDGALSFPLINTVGAVPGVAAAAGANSLVWRNFFLAPLKAGVPSSMTISFVVNIPNTAAVACYQNGAGLAFLDPHVQR